MFSSVQQTFVGRELGRTDTKTAARRLYSVMLNLTKEEVKKIWRNSDAVCFDVDSTVITEEGLDELANFCGRGKEVSEWTKMAMGGGVKFRTALAERLNIFKPTLQQVKEFIVKKPLKLTPGVTDVVQSLKSRGCAVYLVSGGFNLMIEPIASQLGVPKENIFANKFCFNDTGDFVGFDENQPTSDSGGKPKVVQLLKNKHSYKSLVMIGDGVTDMEACPPADAFIGFGGNVVREKVKLHSPWFVTDFKELLEELHPKCEDASQQC